MKVLIAVVLALILGVAVGSVVLVTVDLAEAVMAGLLMAAVTLDVMLRPPEVADIP